MNNPSAEENHLMFLIAVHEAGHALAAESQDGVVIDARMFQLPDGRWTGNTQLMSFDTKKYPTRYIIGTLGGYAATCCLGNIDAKRVWRGAGHDFREAIRFLKDANYPKSDRSRIIREGYDLCRMIFHQNYDSLQKISRAIYERKCLTGEEIRKIIMEGVMAKFFLVKYQFTCPVPECLRVNINEITITAPHSEDARALALNNLGCENCHRVLPKGYSVRTEVTEKSSL